MFVTIKPVSGYIALGIVSTCLTVFPASGQEAEGYLEEIIVTSSGIPVPRRTIGTSVEVVTAAEIEDYGSLSLVDVLRQQTSVGATTSGGVGKTTSLRVRGEEGYRTLAVFDGIRLSDPSAPQVTPLFEHMLASGIGRVEILKGPQGLGYGADAGGVIDMTSPRLQDAARVKVSTEWGDFGTRQVNASVGGSAEQLDYYVVASDLQTDGFNVRAADNVLRDDDGYENTTLHGRLGWQVSNKLRMELVRRDVEGESQFDNCFTSTVVHDCLSRYELGASRIGLEYSGSELTHELSYASSTTERSDFAEGEPAFSNEGQLDRIEYTGSLQSLPGFDLAFGADWEEADADGNSRNNTGYYAEYLSDFSDRLFINLGGRYDDNDDFGSNSSYRASIAYLIALTSGHDLKLKSSYGTGFRAPSPFEIAYNQGPFASPPAAQTDLRQEESLGWEAGLEYASDSGAAAELVYFDQEIENAIVFDLTGFSGYLQEEGSSHSRGVELSGELPVSAQLSLRANYTFNETERPGGQQRLRRPEHMFNAGLAWETLENRLHVNVFYRGARDAIDEVFGTTVALSDYDVLDLNASYALNRNIDLFVRLENATDENYEEISGFFSAERAVYGGFRLQF